MKLNFTHQDLKEWMDEIDSPQEYTEEGCKPNPRQIIVGVLASVLLIWKDKDFSLNWKSIGRLFKTGKELLYACNDYKEYRECINKS